MAQYLREQGYRAYALRGGFDAWVRAGLPTDPKSAAPRRTAADVCPDCGRPLSAHGGRRAGE